MRAIYFYLKNLTETFRCQFEFYFSWGALYSNIHTAVANLDELKEMLSGFTCHPGVSDLLKKMEDRSSLPSMLAISIIGLSIKSFWPQITKIQDWLF